MKPYITIEDEAKAEITVKKSRFIGQLYPVENVEEANAKIEEIKKQYWDANHNCMAMVIGKGGEYTRCSDDGEPQGTAGIPMLEVLKGRAITNVLAIVTRYFGGTLLGTGGLIRAYGQSVSQAISVGQLVEYRPTRVYQAEFPFALWGKLEARMAAASFSMKEIRYTSCVQADIYVAPERENEFYTMIADLTNGTVVPRPMNDEYLKVLL